MRTRSNGWSRSYAAPRSPPKPRKATRPTRASKLRRVEDKRRRSQLKHTRRRLDQDPRRLIRSAFPRILVHNGHEARAPAPASLMERAHRAAIRRAAIRRLGRSIAPIL